MWTLIYKNIEEEYDAVPNSWLKSHNVAWYSDKSSSTITRLAKEGAAPEDDWLELSIDVKKRDYENFERCMEDAFRIQNGRNTLTASEEEDRGRGLRKVNRRSRDTPDSSSDEQQLSKKKSRASFPQLSKRPTVTLSPQIRPVQTQSTSKEGQHICKIKKKHFCPYATRNEVNLSSLADSLCCLSRNVQAMKTLLQESLLEMKSLVEAQTTSVQLNDTCEDEEDLAASVDEIVNKFPFRTLESFNTFSKEYCCKTNKKRTMLYSADFLIRFE